MKPMRVQRCAIYTRVSTDHRLEQDFNSLDNQREAAEAFVKSQAHEGWRAVRENFDDGGFSGGSMERPALQRLLAEIQARRVDIVVVYKVDRLTRSLADFAKLVELFDGHGVSFVSVTQAFNTTTSMGRLTLNMLLSFAQFEREVTGERIRDKIAASKRRGIWVGGIVPLGYRVEARKLVPDETEAATVRTIFERYLMLGSLPALQVDLRERGILTRRRALSSGRVIGGVAFNTGALAHLLRNRVYLGEINHHGASFPGEHAAIVPGELFAAVGAKLDANFNGRHARRAASGALLVGRIYDDRRNRMSPSTANKGAVRYRYYVSCALAQGRASEAGSVRRVSAIEIEARVLDALRATRKDDLGDRALVDATLESVTVHPDRLELTLCYGDGVSVPYTHGSAKRHREIIAGPTMPHRPMKAETRSVLLRQMALGRRWLDQVVAVSITMETIAGRERCSKRQVERTLLLAFLAPSIVEAAAAAKLARGISSHTLADAPVSWAGQQAMLNAS